MSKYVGGSIGEIYIREFESEEDRKLWNGIYCTLSEYGGFNQQSNATDSLYYMHGKKIIKGKFSKKKLKKFEKGW